MTNIQHVKMLLTCLRMQAETLIVSIDTADTDRTDYAFKVLETTLVKAHDIYNYSAYGKKAVAKRKLYKGVAPKKED